MVLAAELGCPPLLRLQRPSAPLLALPPGPPARAVRTPPPQVFELFTSFVLMTNKVSRFPGPGWICLLLPAAAKAGS